MSEAPPKKIGFRSRLASALKPKAGKKLTKEPPPAYDYEADVLDSLNQVKSDVPRSESLYPASESASKAPPTPVQQKKPINFYNKNTTGVQAQTGELWDEAEMLHSFLRRDSFDSLASLDREHRKNRTAWDESRKRGESMIASLPPGLWEHITSYLTPTDHANLAFSCKTFHSIMGPGVFSALNLPENRQYKCDFLLPMDRLYPDHLLCFPCAVYHRRIQKGQERIKHNHTLNPIFNCPNPKLQSKARITPGWTLPFSLVQLAFRAERYGPEYGIPVESLNKRYKCRSSEWTHQTRYYFHKGHLLLRVVSTCFAEGQLPPSMQRHLLYWREDYTPYFSVCAHWRDGELMNLCKCALSHIPPPRAPITQQLKSGPAIHLALRNPKVFISLCSECRPMRRCPECPTEYLIELKLTEDKNAPDPFNRFKQAIVVTRWSDLGDGRSPESPEWKACIQEESSGFDSFKALSRRGLSGTFEAQSGVTIPGQRMLSLNPANVKEGEEGHNWY
jgi:hypothetical protein